MMMHRSGSVCVCVAHTYAIVTVSVAVSVVVLLKCVCVCVCYSVTQLSSDETGLLWRLLSDAQVAQHRGFSRVL